MLLRLKKNKKGFTLIELIVVVAIIAILAAIAVPQFVSIQNRAQRGVDVANATAVVNAINVQNSLPNSTKITSVDAITAANLSDDLEPAGVNLGNTHVTHRIGFQGTGNLVAFVSNVSVEADPS